MKSEKKLSVYENLIWNTIGSFTYLICQWLLTLIVVRVSDGFGNAGNLALAISVTNIFFNLACFNVRPYLISDLENKFSSEQYCSFRIFSCASSVLLCFIYSSFFRYSKEQMLCIMLYMVFKLTEAWVDLYHGFEQRKSRMDIGGISLFARGILSVVSFTVALKLTQSVNWGIAIMTITVFIFIVVFDVPNVKKFENITFRFKKDHMFIMLKEFFPLTVGALMSSIGTNLPRQALQAELGSDILGIYSTVATPAVFVQVAASYIFNPVLVEFAELYRNKNYKKFMREIGKISGVLIGLIVICLIGGKLVGRLGLTILYGAKISQYADALMSVLLFTGLNAFVWFFWNLLIVMRLQKKVVYINGVGLVVCLAIMRPMIIKYQMNGVSYVLILYSVVLIILMLYEIKRNLRVDR